MSRPREILNQLIYTEFYRNIVRMFSGMFAARLFPSLFALVIVRIYSPENFGLFVLYLTIASVISIFSTGRYEQAIVLTDNLAEQTAIFRFSKKLNLRINALIFLLFVGYLLFFPAKGNTTMALLLLLPLYAYYFAGVQLIRHVLISRKEYTRLSYLEVWRAITIGTLQCLLFLLPKTGLFLGATVAQAIIYYWYDHQIGTKKLFPEISFKADELALAKRYINFPKYSVASELLNFTSSQLPVLLIKPFFGANMLGQYSFPHRYFSIPVQLFSQSIAQVYVKEVGTLKENRNELSRLSYALFRRQVYFSLPPFTVLAIWGEEIFRVLFGPDWSFAGQLAQYIAPWLFAVAVSSPLSSILTAMEKQRESLLFNILLICFRTTALLIGIFVLHNIEWAIALYSLTGFAFFAFLGTYALSLAGVSPGKTTFFVLKLLLLISLPLILLKLWI